MSKERRPASRLAWVILVGALLVAGGAAAGKKWLNNEVSAVAGSAGSALSGTGDAAASQVGKVRGVAGVRTSEAGKVTVEVRWDGRTLEQNDTEIIVLEVEMNTHTVELNYDLTRLAVLRNDRGEKLPPKLWKAPTGGHHVSGMLTFEVPEGFLANSSGLELIIRDVGGVPERLFRWNLIATGSESATKTEETKTKTK